MIPAGFREVRFKIRPPAPCGRREMLAATPSLAGFERPVLVVWDSEGKMMPTEHGTRLAESFPNAGLVEVADSYTLVPIDQPLLLAEALGTFATVQPDTAE